MNERNADQPADSDETIGLPNRPKLPNLPRPHIPNYRFIKPIGNGAFGAVWLAEETVAGVFRAVTLRSVIELSLRKRNVRLVSPLSALMSVMELCQRPMCVRLVSPLRALTSVMELSERPRLVRLVSSLSALMSVSELWERPRLVRLVSPLSALMSVIE